MTAYVDIVNPNPWISDDHDELPPKLKRKYAYTQDGMILSSFIYTSYVNLSHMSMYLPHFSHLIHW